MVPRLNVGGRVFVRHRPPVFSVVLWPSLHLPPPLRPQVGKRDGLSVGSRELLACVDLTNSATGVSDCSARAAIGYCTRYGSLELLVAICHFPFRRYYVNLMRQQCRRTCGYCTVSSTSTNSCEFLWFPSYVVHACFLNLQLVSTSPIHQRGFPIVLVSRICARIRSTMPWWPLNVQWLVDDARDNLRQ